MNKKLLLIILISMFATFSASIFVCFVGYKMFAPRIYSADLQLIKKQFYKSADVEKRIKAMVDGANAQLAQMREQMVERQKKIKELGAKVKSAKTEIEKRRINEDEIVPLIKEFTSQRDLAKRFSEEVRAKIAKTMREENRKMFAEIKEEIRKYALARRASYVLESGSNFYCVNTRDISNEIIRRLNAKKSEPVKRELGEDETKAPSISLPTDDVHKDTHVSIPSE